MLPVITRVETKTVKVDEGGLPIRGTGVAGLQLLQDVTDLRELLDREDSHFPHTYPLPIR